MLRRTLKILAYTAAALTVLLAIAVGLLRIALPQVPEYRDEIIARISEAIDGDISFDRLDARWRLRGPEVVLYDVVIGQKLGARRIRPIEVAQVTVGVSVTRLVLSRQLELRHMGISGTRLEVHRDAAGLWLQDALLVPAGTDANPDGGVDADVAAAGGLQLPIGSSLDLRLTDVALTYEDRGNRREPIPLAIESAGVSVDGRGLRIDAVMTNGDGGARAAVLVNGEPDAPGLEGLLDGRWSLSADLDRVSADLVRRILPQQWRLPRAGLADLQADAEVEGGALNAAVIAIDADRLVPPDGGDESQVAGRIEWSRAEDGWLCAVSGFVVGVADRQWPAANLTIGLTRGAGAAALRFDAANVTVYDVPYLASFLPGPTADALLATGLSGTLKRGDGVLRFDATTPLSALGRDDVIAYELNADFDGIGLAPAAGLPGARNLTGELRVTADAGRLRLASTDTTLLIPALFDDGLRLDLLEGTLVWRGSDRGVSLLSDAVRIESASFAADSSLQLLLPAGGGAPELDVQARWSMGDVSDVVAMLPDAVVRPKLYTWFETALVGGRVRDGTFQIRGALDRFPFDEGDGAFRATGYAEDLTLRYGRQWPDITRAEARIELDGMRLSTVENRGLTGGLPFENARVSFADLRTGVLDIETEGNAALEDVKAFAGETPIRRLFAGQFDNLGFAGLARYAVRLQVPTRAVRDFTVDASIDVSDAAFELAMIPHAVSALDGSVRIDRKGVYADGVTGVLLGQPITLDMAPEGSGESAALVIRGEGRLDAAALTGPLGLPLQGRADGGTAYAATVTLPRRPPGAVTDPVAAPRRPVTVAVTSSLEGLAIDLPYPVGKAAGEATPADLRVTVAETLDVQAGLADRVDVAMRAARDADGRFAFDRMTLHLGEGRALLPAVSGVFIDGTTDRLRLGDWLSLRLGDAGWFTDNLVSAAVQVADLYVFGQRIRDVRASLERSGDDWVVDVQSEAIEGAISIPRALDGGQPVVLDMRKLHLLEADPEAGGDADPTAFPPLRIRAASFALGVREFGALDATIDKVADGLEATRIATAAPAFRIEGSGAWRLAPASPAGSRTTMSATVASTDVERMMNSLGYAPGINASSLDGSLDVAWDGGPGKDFVASLDGDVSLRISNGTLDDVEPGAGRVVGLMSVAELPRRLALDFRDVFQKGFNFDEIVGDFRLVNGDAYTCNLRLAGPSADVALIGRASLAKRNYNQTAVVGVKVGNTLPAVGAVVAGPQVGAALFLFSQIFKKPLEDMTEVYYQINGSWDAPGIERTDAARFLATSELAGCTVDTGG